MEVGKIEFVPQKDDGLLKLAQHISEFKTSEMEIVFAQYMKKVMNPPMIYRDLSEIETRKAK